MRLGLLAVVFVGVVLGGCMQTGLEHPKLAKMSSRDNALLKNAPYAKADIQERFRPHIVRYARKERPGTILVDSNARYLYLVLPGNKAIRYGIAVGEEALAFSGVARVGRKREWPSWTPTAEIKRRLPGTPDFVKPGPRNPLGARALYLYQNGKDTLYRIHGTNQPEYIGWAISSGCIRMTNEAVVDLYSRVKLGAIVVVLPLKPGGAAGPTAGQVQTRAEVSDNRAAYG